MSVDETTPTHDVLDDIMIDLEGIILMCVGLDTRNSNHACAPVICAIGDVIDAVTILIERSKLSV